MAYKMRYRVVVRAVQNPGTATPGDPAVIEAGDTTTDLAPASGNAGTPTGPILTSLVQATSAAMSINNRFQRGLKFNVRFQVFGRPVGHAEAGNPDLTADEKEEVLYIQGDTPSIGLLYAIAQANRKPRVGANNGAGYSYFPPEIGSPDEADPTPG